MTIDKEYLDKRVQLFTHQTMHVSKKNKLLGHNNETFRCQGSHLCNCVQNSCFMKCVYQTEKNQKFLMENF